ncbi:MAG: hypothetical protein ACRDYE_06285 [Acidimicrobiales bacterium]
MLTGSVMSLNATFVVELVVFLAVLAIVAKFITGPLQDAMQQRRAEIDASMENVRRAEGLLAQAEADYHSRVAQARIDTRRITDGARRVADHLRDDGRQEARLRSEQLLTVRSRDKVRP